MIRELAVERDREDFFTDGADPGSVRDEIAASWRRCAHLRVPAEQITPPYAPDFDPDGPLLRAALPVLDHVNERLGDVGISFLLTDASARILDRRSSNSQLLHRLDRVSATAGFIFTEEAAGTNGIGTAVELRQPVRVDGHEHYADDLRQFTCVGIPIFGVDRRLNGLLDVSCVADHNNTVVSFIAEQAAEKIEQRLLAQQAGAERALLDAFLTASRRGRGSFFVINDRVLITSPRAGQLLDGVEQALVWDQVSRLIRSRDRRVHELDLPGGRRILLRTEAVRDGGEQVGAIVELREPPEPAPEPAQAAPPPKPLPGLVGADPAWLRACATVADTAGREIVVVCGEPGVGKLAVCRAVHAGAAGGRIVVQDAACMPMEGPSSWLGRLRSQLDGMPGTVIVRHLEGLSPVSMAAVLAVLATARAARWRCLATWSGSASEASARVGGPRKVVELPPLRSRSADIPALAKAFAAPRRLAPEAMSLLLRVPWSGNTRALRDAIEHASTVSTTPDIRVAALPTEVRSSAFRRRMSRFEQAELSVILDAMAEVAGNKKAAAELLGISRSTLYRKLEVAGLVEA